MSTSTPTIGHNPSASRHFGAHQVGSAGKSSSFRVATPTNLESIRLKSAAASIALLPKLKPSYTTKTLQNFLHSSISFFSERIKISTPSTPSGLPSTEISSNLFSTGGNPVLAELIESIVNQLPSIHDAFWHTLKDEERIKIQSNLYNILLISLYAGVSEDPLQKTTFSYSSCIVLAFWLYAVIDKLSRLDENNKLSGFTSAFTSLLIAIKDPTFTLSSPELNKLLDETLTYFDPEYRLDETLLDRTLKDVHDTVSAVQVHQEKHLDQLFDDMHPLNLNKDCLISPDHPFALFIKQFNSLDAFNPEHIPNSARILMQTAWACKLLATKCLQIKPNLFDRLDPNRAINLLRYTVTDSSGEIRFSLRVNNEDKVECPETPSSSLQEVIKVIHPAPLSAIFPEHHAFTRRLNKEQRKALATILSVKAFRDYNFDLPTETTFLGLDSKSSLELLSIGINPYDEANQILIFLENHLENFRDKGLQYLLFIHLFAHSSLHCLHSFHSTLTKKILPLCQKAIRSFAKESPESALFFVALSITVLNFSKEQAEAIETLKALIKEILSHIDTKENFIAAYTLLFSLYAMQPPSDITANEEFILAYRLVQEHANFCLSALIPYFNITKILAFTAEVQRATIGQDFIAIDAQYSTLQRQLESLPSSPPSLSGSDEISEIAALKVGALIPASGAPIERSPTLPIFLGQRQNWQYKDLFNNGWENTYTIFNRSLYQIKISFQNTNFLEMAKLKIQGLSLEQVILGIGTLAFLILKVSYFMIPVIAAFGLIYIGYQLIKKLSLPSLRIYAVPQKARSAHKILYSSNLLNPAAKALKVYPFSAILLIKEANTSRITALLLGNHEATSIYRALKEDKQVDDVSVSLRDKQIALYGTNGKLIIRGSNKFPGKELKESGVLKALIDECRATWAKMMK